MTKYYTNWDDDYYRLDFYENRCNKLEKALSDLLDIIDGKEYAAINSIAIIYGFKVNKKIANENEKIINNAYEILGRKRKTE